MKKLAAEKLELKNLTVRKLTSEQKFAVKGGIMLANSSGCTVGPGCEPPTQWPLSCSQPSAPAEK